MDSTQLRVGLDGLTASRLRALVDATGAQPADRRAKAALLDALTAVPLPTLLAALLAPELKALCAALGLDAKGTKDALAARLLGAAAVAAEPLDASPASARSAGELKSSLRRFALSAPGGYRGKQGRVRFAAGLLACFGWPDGRAPGLELPASLAIVEHGQRVSRPVTGLWRERRVVLEVTEPDVALDPAWKDLLHACLQVDPPPQYVLLTNQRDMRLYDLSRGRERPLLAFAVDDLAKHSDALPFLREGWQPGAAPAIVNTDRVSREVADLVARLYRRLQARFPQRKKEVIRFTLQCVLTMFAEDIGLLPRQHFTALLYEGARRGDVEARLRELFRLMSTRDVPERAIAYFNGGLFTDPVVLPLAGDELQALTRAAEANWRHVDPHIFGSVFQGIMDDAERHASGAHYTAHDDILRVVGPTIVEPWRKRIAAARTLAELLDLRAELLRFRVLDPACGSGNFLYVAFLELYRLDTELLARLREFPSAQGPKAKGASWGACLSAQNFYGLDRNEFAVELAKVTLNIAKKLAFEERRAKAAEVQAQFELEVDPSLPLDNLDQNILCADALFTPWPEVEAIVGNPPFLGDRKIRAELGAAYLKQLQRSTGVDGVVDLCCYWFRKAHDQLRLGGRAGLVGTSGIRVGKAREAALDYLVERGGTITNAVSSVVWPGEAALHVSMVNWVKGPVEGPHALTVDGRVVLVPRIPTHLQLHTDASTAKALRANEGGTTMGVILGNDGFLFPVESDKTGALRRSGVLRPVAAGNPLLTDKLRQAANYLLDLSGAETEQEAKKRGGLGFSYLKQHLYPHVHKVADQYDGWLARWWQPWRPRGDFFSTVAHLSRYIVCSNPQARPIYVFLSTSFVPTNTLQVFAFDDDYSFGVLQSGAHWAWLLAKGGERRQDIRYTSAVWSTFPWPQEPPVALVAAVAAAGRELRAVRARLMQENGWSLRALHQAADVPGPHALKDAQRALDDAVAEAYGMDPAQDPTEFLLELNGALAEDEEEGRPVGGPGLPRGFDPKDPRWFSTDCIEPPPLED